MSRIGWAVFSVISGLVLAGALFFNFPNPAYEGLNWISRNFNPAPAFGNIGRGFNMFSDALAGNFSLLKNSANYNIGQTANIFENFFNTITNLFRSQPVVEETPTIPQPTPPIVQEIPPTQQPTIIREVLPTERIIEKVETVNVVERVVVDQNLLAALSNRIDDLQSQLNQKSSNLFQVIAHSQPPPPSDLNIQDDDIPDSITVSNYLPLSGGSVTGTLGASGTGTSTYSGGLTLAGSAGTVGISSSTPGAMLGVGGSAIIANNLSIAGNVDIQGSCTGCGAGSASGWTDNGTTITLDTSTDLIGIGTDTPTTKLEVAGGGLFKGLLTVEGDIKVSNLAATSTISVATTTVISGSVATIDGSLALTSSNGAVIIGDVTGNARGKNSVDVQSQGLRSATDVASGDHAIVIGIRNEASAVTSFAAGYNNKAQGIGDSTVGQGNSIGSGSVNASAFGYGNSIVSGTSHGSILIGNTNKITSSQKASAVGILNTISSGSQVASAFGYQNNSSATYSSAFGDRNTASALAASAFGSNNTASALGASVFGSGITNAISSSTQIGPTDAAKITILGEDNVVGFVGIGTTSPFGLLSVEATTDVGSTTPIFVVGDEGTSTPFLYISGNDGNVGIATSSPGNRLSVGGNGVFKETLTVDDHIKTSFLIATSTTATSTFAGGIAAATKGFVYDFSTGRVGINTAQPSAPLEIVNTANSNSNQGITSTHYGSAGDTGGILNFRHALTSEAAPSALRNRDMIGTIFFWGRSSAAPFWVRSAAMGSVVKGNPGGNTVPQSLFFSVTSNGGSTSDMYPSNVKMVVDGTGVGIFTLNPSTALDVNGDVTIGGSDILIGNYQQATTTIHGEYGKLGIGTTTPFGQVSIESVEGIVGSTTPIFVVGDEGTSTPFLYVSGNDGSIGIATSSPGNRLSVGGNGVFKETLTVDDHIKTSFLIATSTTATSTFSGGLDVTTTGGLSSNAGLRVNAGESYFDERVGINTISPETTLEVVHETNSSTQGITVTGGNVGGSLHLRGSKPGPSASSNGNILGNLFFSGYATNGAWVRNAMIGGVVNGTVGSGIVPTDIFFQVSSGGGSSSSYTPTQVRMLINGTGVGIANIRPSTALDVGGVVTIGGSEILLGNYKQATTTIHGEYGKLGFGTTSPFGQIAIESVQGIVGSTTPIFVVGDEGTSSPLFYISGVDGNIGIGTDTPAGILSITNDNNSGAAALLIQATGGNVAIQVDSDDNCKDGSGDPAACSLNDLAELFPFDAAQGKPEAGDIVAFDHDKPGYLKKAIRSDSGQAQRLAGAISSSPAIVFEGGSIKALSGTYNPSDNKLPLALSGRVPVKVNLESGEIKIGDPITLSSVAGIGTKATQSSQIVGYALENYNSADLANDKTKILILAELGFWMNNDLELSPTVSDSGSLLQIIDSIIAKVKEWLTQTAVTIKEVVTDRLAALKLQVGTSEKPAGITIYDFETKAPYCFIIRGGQPEYIPGECTFEASASNAETPTPTPTPSPTPTPTPSPTGEPTPTSSPTPTPTPTPIPTLTPTPTPTPSPTTEPIPTPTPTSTPTPSPTPSPSPSPSSQEEPPDIDD